MNLIAHHAAALEALCPLTDVTLSASCGQQVVFTLEVVLLSKKRITATYAFPRSAFEGSTKHQYKLADVAVGVLLLKMKRELATKR